MGPIYFWIPIFDESRHQRNNYGDQLILKFIIYTIFKVLIYYNFTSFNRNLANKKYNFDVVD